MGNCACKTCRDQFEQGQRDMLAKCIVAVEAFDDVDEIPLIIAALRALQEKP